MPFNLGFGEVLVILVVALLVFGGRLPEVGRNVGRSLKEFKEGLKAPAEEPGEEPAAEPKEPLVGGGEENPSA